MGLIGGGAAGSSAVAEEAHIFGLWREPAMRAEVKVYACGAHLCGDLVQLPADAPREDIHNPDPTQQGRDLQGLTIIEGFRRLDPSGKVWVGGGDFGRIPGRIYVPSNGDTLGDAENTYAITLIDPDTLTIAIHNCVLTCFGKSKWVRISSEK
ncbi:MAG: DUF2147 domain-containing protein [Magnetospiraceae bacterium]